MEEQKVEEGRKELKLGEEIRGKQKEEAKRKGREKSEEYKVGKGVKE